MIGLSLRLVGCNFPHKSGGIVGCVAAGPRPALRMRFAPLEIFPQRRRQPVGARAVALAVTGWEAFFALFAACHAASDAANLHMFASGPAASPASNRAAATSRSAAAARVRM